MPRLHTSLLTATVAWGLSLGVGLSYLHSYEATPGLPGAPCPRWPEGSQIHPEPGRANLILFAHPRCPCTRASLEELAGILERCRGTVAAHVLFFHPVHASESWGPTDLWSRASAIPGVRVRHDPNGSEAARFGVGTSGHVSLYDRSGALLYTGGITPARGRIGENPGRDGLILRIDGESEGLSCSPVFGCPILEDLQTSGELDDDE